MVDGDDVVGVDVVVAARAETWSVEGGCASRGMSVRISRSRGDAVKIRTITSRLGHLDTGEGGRGGGESDEDGSSGEAHVERREYGSERKLTSK